VTGDQDSGYWRILLAHDLYVGEETTENLGKMLTMECLLTLDRFIEEVPNSDGENTGRKIIKLVRPFLSCFYVRRRIYSGIKLQDKLHSFWNDFIQVKVVINAHRGQGHPVMWAIIHFQIQSRNLFQSGFRCVEMQKKEELGDM